MVNCKKCGAVIPAGLDSCLICGTKPGEQAQQLPQPEYIAEPAAITTKAVVKRHPKAMTHVLIGVSILIILAVAVVWAMQILPYYFGTSSVYRSKNAIIYSTDNGDLKFMSPSAEGSEILAQNLGRLDIIDAKASPNGRYIAYLIRDGSAGGRLCLRDFSTRPTVTQTEHRDIEISADAESFFFDENSSHIIYLTSGGGLYSYDFRQSYLLDENVRGVYDCYDGKILYTCGYGSDSEALVSTLYVGEYLSGSNSKSAVAEDVAALIDHTPAFDRFIFTVRQDASGQAVYDIVAVDLKQNSRQTLATGAEKVITADAKSFTALYQTNYGNPLHYDNIINDDLARDDDKVIEPDLEEYPLLNEFYEKYGSDASYEGSLDYEDIAEESAKFDAALEAYTKMRENKKLRQRILLELDNFVLEYPTLYDLYLCRDGNVSRISESSYSPFNDAKLDVSNGVVSWRETNFTVLEKILFSVYPQDKELSGLLTEKLSDKLYIQRFGQNAVQIRIGERDQSFTCGGWQLVSKSDGSRKEDGVYFAMSEGTPPISKRNSALPNDYLPLDCTLYYYYTGSNPEANGRIFTMDSNVGAVGEMLDGERLLYFKDISGNICDLYMLDGTNTDSVGQRVGENISLLNDYFKLENNGKTLLFCERFNGKTKSGNLFMYTKQNRQLSTDVTDIYYRSDSLVYFTRNYHNGKVDLYSFGTNGPVMIETDVVAVHRDEPAFNSAIG